MTDKPKNWLNKIATALGILVIIVGFIGAMTRTIDLSVQTAKAVNSLACKIEAEIAERILEDKKIIEALNIERELSREENKKIFVKLTELDTSLMYLKQNSDWLNDWIRGGTK